MEEIKYFKVEVPKGYEIDKENSTFERICFKKIEQSVKTWDDLIGKKMPNSSMLIGADGDIMQVCSDFEPSDKNSFVDKKHAKSALAMAQISQLIPYFGGRITDEEWKDKNSIKYIIEILSNRIITSYSSQIRHFLAFHTEEQRDNFLKYNERLVKDYLMLD